MPTDSATPRKKTPGRMWSTGSGSPRGSPKTSPRSSPKGTAPSSRGILNIGRTASAPAANMKKFGSRKMNNTSSSSDMDASHTSSSNGAGRTRTDSSDDPSQPKRSSIGHGTTVFTKGVTKMVQAPFKAGMYAGQRVVEAGTRTSNAVVHAGNTVVLGGKAVGTTVGNTMVYSANTIVGGGKAIVEGTGAVVEYSGKTMVKGVKGLVTAPFALTKRAGKTKSKWDEGVEVIDSMLDPNTETYAAMSDDQRKALANVKKLLLRGPSEQDRISHIPQDLLKEGKKEQRDIRRRNTAHTAKSSMNRRASTNFILQEYAGLRNNAALVDDFTESEADDESNSLSDHSDPIVKDDALGKPSTHSVMSDTDMDLYYLPAEFRDLSTEDQKKICGLLSWENLSRWDFNIFEVDLISKNNPLLFVGWAVLGSPHAQVAMEEECGLSSLTASESGYKFLPEYNIPPRKLCNYLRVIQQDYHAENPYHNAIHAADVVQSLNALLQMTLGQGALSYCPTAMIFSILLSAAVHDVDHPGKTNAFHTKLRTELAVMYNDTSVLENWHIAHAFARMLDMDLFETHGKDITMAREIISAKMNHQNRNSEFNILCNVTPDVFNTIRNYMIEAVLHTDMTKHFAMVNAAKGMLLDDEITGEDRAWKVLMFMLHMADINGQAKPAPMFMLWTQRCMAEFFSQGDEEAALGLPISPNCDRQSVVTADSQMGFIKFVVGPAYSVLGEYIPAVQENVLPLVERNLEHWSKEKALLEGTASADC